MPTCPYCHRYFVGDGDAHQKQTKRELRDRAEKKRILKAQLRRANRRHEMVCLRQSAPPATYVAIAKQFGITASRVRDIVRKEIRITKRLLPKLAERHDLSGLTERI